MRSLSPSLRRPSFVPAPLPLSGPRRSTALSWLERVGHASWLQAAVVCGAVLCVCAGPAAAVPVTLTFTASGFDPSNGNDAPNNPVSGKIVWEAASATSAIQSLTSIELSLDGHVYTVAELSFISPLPGLGDMIGGSIGDANGTSDLTDDFGILFDLASGTPGAHGSFSYASAKRSGIWDSKTFDQFSITVADQASTAVPEPGSLALMAAALVGLAGVRRRTTSRRRPLA